MAPTLRSMFLLAAVVAAPAAAQTPEADCSAAATQATGYTPGTAGPDGDRVRGAARGAAAGATVGAVQNSRHDNAPDALKDANRQNDARAGAAAGMVAGGSRARQDRRQDRRSADAWQQSYNACLAQKGAVPK